MRFVLWLALLSCLPLLGQRDLSGVAEIRQALGRLNVLGNVLMIAAHPDDENTALLAYFARGRHMRTAYLSLTRGEGGQNLIGPEQGELLGLIRTHELLEARRVDGAEQFFTSAVDFGFSKSADETLAKWGREKILREMVRTIDEFRPDVILLRFSGTPRDGHGHHQASAILGKEAYLAASWKATRLLFNVFAFTPEQQRAAAALPGRLEVDTGEFNPILGRSYTEIAGISRSMHRSQGMGAAQRRGPSENYLTLVAGEPAAKDVFDGIDTSWKRLPGGAPIGEILAQASKEFVSGRPEKIVPLLLKARPLIARIDHPLARRKLQELDETAALCTGLWLEAQSARHTVIAGSPVPVRLTAINRSSFPLRWMDAELPYNKPVSINSNVTGPSQDVRFEIRAGTEALELHRPVLHRYVDPIQGELTRPVEALPPAAVNLQQQTMLFPDGRARELRLLVKANRPRASGTVRLATPAGWSAEPGELAFDLAEAGREAPLTFTVKPPAQSGEVRLQAVARVDGASVTTSVKVISYPHIPPITVVREAAMNLVRADVRNLARSVGYVMGAGDEVPDALRQIGADVALLNSDHLATGDLSAFDAVVIGVRGFNTRPDLRANFDRLLEYVRSGGVMIVQYNVAEGGFFGPKTGALDRIGPYPLEVGRARVTVEEAPVSFPDPDHPLLRFPNRITAEDFKGWVQERGLYLASKWDPRYQPVLESHDPGEQPLPGGMLYARYGKGVYIFSAYAWFRQLPAGVPGAYRIFANMLSAGRADATP
ncbi:MAG: PIG-L family deacetylase [Bryobacteraceae bacterium]